MPCNKQAAATPSHPVQGRELKGRMLYLLVVTHLLLIWAFPHTCSKCWEDLNAEDAACACREHGCFHLQVNSTGNCSRVLIQQQETLSRTQLKPPRTVAKWVMQTLEIVGNNFWSLWFEHSQQLFTQEGWDSKTMYTNSTANSQGPDITALLYGVWWNTFKNVWICEKNRSRNVRYIQSTMKLSHSLPALLSIQLRIH